MIATILPKSSSFHAVAYNEYKVQKGVAVLLEMSNFGLLDSLDNVSREAKIKYLKDYSSVNSRIQYPQFHVAISCKGHEKTEEQLLDFAHKWLNLMGYGEKGQPLLIYAHRDTENTHIHIVTSRINPAGEKIDHNHERRRSQNAIDRILKITDTNKVQHDIEMAMSYKFGSIGQFKAILKSLGYESYQKDDKLIVKYGGTVREQLNISDIENLFLKTEYIKLSTIRARILKYHRISQNLDELSKLLKTKLGYEIVTYGKTDSPSGFFIIDHQNKAILNGSKILTLRTLLDFSSDTDKIEKIKDKIEEYVKLNQGATTSDINKLLWRNHAKIKKGCLYYKSKKIELPQSLVKTIKQNDSKHIVSSFAPTSKALRDVLCNMFKVEDNDSVPITADLHDSTPEYLKALNNIRNVLLMDNSDGKFYRRMKNCGFTIRYDQSGNVYAVNFSSRIIIDFKKVGFYVGNILKQGQTRNNRTPGKLNIGSSKKNGDSINRESEVGNSRPYDWIDDERSLKR